MINNVIWCRGQILIFWSNMPISMVNFSKINLFILMKILDKFIHILKIKNIDVKKWAMYFSIYQNLINNVIFDAEAKFWHFSQIISNMELLHIHMYVLPSYRKCSKNKNLSSCVYKGQRVIFWATTLYRDETYRDCVINSQKKSDWLYIYSTLQI